MPIYGPSATEIKTLGTNYREKGISSRFWVSIWSQPWKGNVKPHPFPPSDHTIIRVGPYTNEWRQPVYLTELGSKVMLVTCGEVCYKLTTGGAEEVLGLLSTQEEADICLLLHTVQAAAQGHKAVIIISDEKKIVSGIFSHILVHHCISGVVQGSTQDLLAYKIL